MTESNEVKAWELYPAELELIKGNNGFYQMRWIGFSDKQNIHLIEISEVLKLRAQVEDMEKNCISLSLHEARVEELENEVRETNAAYVKRAREIEELEKKLREKREALDDLREIIKESRK